MPVKTKKKFSSSSKRRSRANKHNFFYSLDCQSGEGLVNPLLPELKKISSSEFNFYLYFILKKCINVNRSFSDAVEFLSIWLEKSPCILLERLKVVKIIKEIKELEELKKNSNLSNKKELDIMNLIKKLKNRRLREKLITIDFKNKLTIKSLIQRLDNINIKIFFNRTEYDHEGDQWHFPELLQVFTTLVEKKETSANEILDYLFETFDFFTMPEIFVTEIIGYDQLEGCINKSPEVFKQALLRKIQEFVKQHKTIDIGSRSRKYLNDAIRVINPGISFISKNTIFIYPGTNNFNSSDSFIAFPRTNYNKSNNY